MKLNKNILMLFPVMAAALLVSCKEEWQPGEEANYSGINVYFVQPETYYSLDPDAMEITFTVQRDDAPYEDQYVPVTLTAVHPEAFETPEPVFFGEGELEAELTICFTDYMELFKDYSFSLAIDENYTQQYMEQSDYPRIDVTVIKEDYEPAYRCRYTCGGVYLGLISWSNPQVMVDLEYSEILDAYRVDLWGHGAYVNFSVDEDDSLVLDKTTFNTGEEYVNGDETYEILATVSGDCTWNSRSRTYTFPFTYSFGGNSAGEYNDQLVVFSEL